MLKVKRGENLETARLEQKNRVKRKDFFFSFFNLREKQVRVLMKIAQQKKENKLVM